jgi:DNA processing protein
LARRPRRDSPQTPVDVERLRPWLALIRAPGVGAVAVGRLLERFGSAGAILDAGPRQWRAANLSAAQVAALEAPDAAGIDADLHWLAADPTHGLVTLDDPRYPQRLREIPSPPLALFHHGDARVLAQPQIAIVGARSATPQGLENAKAFAAELGRRGLVITSGLALGIDGAAHTGALDAGAPTIAVCGTGLDRVYPARHRDLAHRIAGAGALVSEFPVGIAAQAENFPRRNRIISGLALGVLVVEAALESGSLISARFASEQGREVFAIPGSIHNPLARGCHRLIRQGAKLVESVDDVLEELAPQLLPALREQLGIAAAEPARSGLSARILDALRDDPVSVDALVERLDIGVEPLQAALLDLELEGAIAAASGGRYQRLRR